MADQSPANFLQRNPWISDSLQGLGGIAGGVASISSALRPEPPPPSQYKDVISMLQGQQAGNLPMQNYAVGQPGSLGQQQIQYPDLLQLLMSISGPRQ